MDKMTNDERQEIAERLLEVMKILDNNMEMMGQAKLNDLYLDLTKNEREYPTKGKVKIFGDSLTVFIKSKCVDRVLLRFTGGCALADRRGHKMMLPMYKLIKLIYNDFRKAEKEGGGFGRISPVVYSGWDHQATEIVDFIETGVNNESS